MNNKRTVSGRVRPRPNKENVAYYDIILELGKDPITQKRKQLRYRVNTTSLEEAEKQLLLKQAELLQDKLLEPSTMTVEEFLKENYEIHMLDGMSPTTQRDYRCIMDAYLIPAFGKIQLQKLTYGIIQRTYNQWRIKAPKGKKPLASETINHINRVLKAALNNANKLGYIKDNPATLVKSGKSAERKQQEVFTIEEIRKLQTYVKETDMELPVALLFDCVMRRGELLGLRYCDIDFENNIVKIQHSWVESVDGTPVLKSCKSDSSEREMVVTKKTLELLKKQKILHRCNCIKYGRKFKETDFVICKENGDAFLPHSFTQKWSRTLKKYNIRHLKLHATRHSAISMLLSEGVPIHMVQARAGHQNPEITLAVYSHVAKDKQSVVAEKLESLLIS